MSLPVTLLSGQVSLLAADASLRSIEVEDGGYGTVDAKATDVTSVAVGNFVAYRRTDYVTKVSFGGADYYILPATQLLYIETPLP